MNFLLLFVWFCCHSEVAPFISPTSAYADSAYRPQFAELPSSGLNQQSDYSHILVRDSANRRSLYFVRDSGEVVLESSVDMKQPNELMVPYTKVMMSAQICRPKATSVLMIGVGGGGMVHYLQAYFPQVLIDAVDIDPAIIEIAEDYFALQASEKLRLHAADGFQFIAETSRKYDIVFMDAFLKPSVDTDPTGTHLRLKTLSFYEQLKARLNPSGVVAFNINPHPLIEQDIETIRASFNQVWVLSVPQRGNTIVLASTATVELTALDLTTVAKSLDTNLKTSISYSDLVPLIYGLDL